MSNNAPSDGMLGQILVQQGVMGEKLAVITTKLEAVPDHEARIRALEKWKYSLPITLLLAIVSVALTILGYVRK
jgi:hypothetical protein